MSGCDGVPGLKKLFYAGFTSCTDPQLDEEGVFGASGPSPNQVERSFYREGLTGNGALAVIFRAVVADHLGKEELQAAITFPGFGNGKVELPLRGKHQHKPAERDKRVEQEVTPSYLNRIEQMGGLVQRREDAELRDGRKIVHCDRAITAAWAGAIETALAWHYAKDNDLEYGYAELSRKLSTREGTLEVLKLILGEDSVVDVNLSGLNAYPEQLGNQLAQMAAIGERGFALAWKDGSLPRTDGVPVPDHLYEFVGGSAKGLELSDAEGNRYPQIAPAHISRDLHVFVATWGGNKPSPSAR